MFNSKTTQWAHESWPNNHLPTKKSKRKLSFISTLTLEPPNHKGPKQLQKPCLTKKNNIFLSQHNYQLGWFLLCSSFDMPETVYWVWTWQCHFTYSVIKNFYFDIFFFWIVECTISTLLNAHMNCSYFLPTLKAFDTWSLSGSLLVFLEPKRKMKMS